MEFKKKIVTYDLVLNMLKDFSDEEVDDRNEVVAPDDVWKPHSSKSFINKMKMKFYSNVSLLGNLEFFGPFTKISYLNSFK